MVSSLSLSLSRKRSGEIIMMANECTKSEFEKKKRERGADTNS